MEFKEETVTTTAKPQTTGADILIGKTLLETDLAAVLGVSKATVQKLRYDGKIPYVMISSGKPIYLVDSILEWLKRREIDESKGKLFVWEDKPNNDGRAENET